MGLIAKLLASYWQHLLLVALFAAYTAFIFHKGGEAPRAEIAALEATIEAAEVQRRAKDEADKARSKADTERRDKEWQARLDRVSSDWTRDRDEWLRNDEAARRRHERENQSVRISAEVSNNATLNQGLSDALSSFVKEARGALASCREAAADFRTEAGRLAEAAQTQVGDLIDVQEWAIEQRRIWSERPGGP